jgi:hypothetical protein
MPQSCYEFNHTKLIWLCAWNALTKLPGVVPKFPDLSYHTKRDKGCFIIIFVIFHNHIHFLP